MKTFVIAPALAALALFVFGAIYWMSPFPYVTLTPVGDNTAAATALAQIFPTTGTYLIPGPDVADRELLTELHRRGPLARVQFIKEGREPMDPAIFFKGYLHYFAVCVAFVLLIRAAGPLSRRGIIRLTTLAGLTAGIFACLSDPIWWGYPWSWHLVMAVYILLGSALAGLVLGPFLRSRPAPATA